MEAIKLIECPRDAWQGLATVIPTQVKANYLRCLIEAGFRHIDAVSFVSPKYVPQMADSEEVMQILDGGGLLRPATAPMGRSEIAGPTGSAPAHRGPEIIGIVVNRRGLDRALRTPGVTTIGYPHSLSARFLRQNASLSPEESRTLLKEMKTATDAAGRNFVAYISMAFGSPYGEAWTPEEVAKEVQWLKSIGVRTISLADTVGKAEAEDVSNLFRTVMERVGESNEEVEIGVHLHSRPEGAAEKVLAAFEAGCRRFDSALTGLGGCPFAGDELVGNIPTEVVIAALTCRGVSVAVTGEALRALLAATQEIRRQYAHP